MPLEGNGNAGFAKICRNFTQEEFRERQRESALQAERATRDRLQEASILKDEFLAVVSHELKNPLSVIKMNAQMLARLPGVHGNERALRATASIETAVSSQVQIINDLLEFSRANMSKLVLTLSYFDLAETVRNITESIGNDALAKSQTLRVRTVPASIHADPVRVEQIVWNLVTNAVKFTPDGGTIEVDLSTQDGMACLSVKDSGIGLDPTHLQGVFEMFHQVDTGLNRRTGGLGIGLALVKQMVELHGGRVAAASTGLGQGACFKVWLPLKTAALDTPTANHLPAYTLENLHILVVDNEPQLLQALGALLESEGAQVTLCTSAEEAVRIATEGKFDAVISDLAMPEHDGHWLAQQLRAHDATRHLALIAVSGMTRDTDRSQAEAAGFSAHLNKPVDLNLLEETLFKILQLSQ